MDAMDYNDMSDYNSAMGYNEPRELMFKTRYTKKDSNGQEVSQYISPSSAVGFSQDSTLHIPHATKVEDLDIKIGASAPAKHTNSSVTKTSSTPESDTESQSYDTDEEEEAANAELVYKTSSKNPECNFKHFTENALGCTDVGIGESASSDTGSSGAGSQVSGRIGIGGIRINRFKRSQKRRNNGTDDQNDGEDDNDSNPSRQKKKFCGVVDLWRKLACPFAKGNSKKYPTCLAINRKNLAGIK
ncbi:hypothetical protein ABW20_dc0108295 [Dactylellina cionopaga]|nr:hypothetical protein ABW20_dc0108295 [Dactylellina cionopaga]